MTGNFDWFQTYEAFMKPIPVNQTAGTPSQALGQGSIALEALVGNRWLPVTLENVMYVEGAVNLLSEIVVVKKVFIITLDRLRTTYRHPGIELVDYLHKNTFIMDFRFLGNERKTT